MSGARLWTDRFAFFCLVLIVAALARLCAPPKPIVVAASSPRRAPRPRTARRFEGMDLALAEENVLGGFRTGGDSWWSTATTQLAERPRRWSAS